MVTVYALELENGRYYVGKTCDIEKRFKEHMGGYKSSAWTRKYRPLSIIETIEDAHCLDEDKLTVDYMMRYGISNVRGGPYVTIKLSEDTVFHITNRIRMASDLCMKCGKRGHFGVYCTETETKSSSPSPVLEPPVCATCGSGFHFTEDCEFSAETDVGVDSTIHPRI